MTIVAMVMAAALLAGPEDTRRLEAELKLAQSENRALRATVKRLENDNVWLTGEVKRLNELVEKLKAQVAGLSKQVAEVGLEPRPADDQSAKPAPPSRDGPPADFDSFEAIIDAFPAKAYPNGSEAPGRVSAKALEWFRAEVIGKTVTISFRADSVDIPAPGKAVTPAVQGAGATKDAQVEGRACSWRCASVNAQFGATGAVQIRAVKLGDTVLVHGRVERGIVTVQRLVGRDGKISFAGLVTMSLTGCKLVKVVPAKAKPPDGQQAAGG